MSEDLQPTAYYFGCYGDSGHYLWGRGMVKQRDDRLCVLDGDLAPITNGKQQEFIAQGWRLTGWADTDWSAISWWDRSVDKRPGSNSIIIAPGHTVTLGGMHALAHRFFPQVMGRLPQVLFLPSFKLRTREVKT